MTQHRGFGVQEGGQALPACDTKPPGLCNVSFVRAIADNCVVGMGGLAHLCRDAKPWSCVASRGACLLCHAADMSTVSHSRDVCCVTQQTRLLRHTADTSAASHIRHVCCFTQQTCRLCVTADISETCPPMVYIVVDATRDRRIHSFFQKLGSEASMLGPDHPQRLLIS